jgi:hypothetical protein
MPGKFPETPFVLAEIVDSEVTAATVRYGIGFNCSRTNQPEVLRHVRHPDGKEFTYVIMRGLSSDKATAIALILNAPEF